MVKPWLKAGKFLWSGTKPLDCATCPCPTPAGCAVCTSSAATIDVQFSSVVDNGNCATCDTGATNYNNTVITLNQLGSSCNWGSSSGVVCSGHTISVIFVSGVIQGSIIDGSYNTVAYFELTGGSTWDCTALNDLAYVLGDDTGCDFTGATMRINP